jgi:hypothetical protein
VAVDPQDQEKTTFTCPFGTFAYRRMPFGLCNAPATFQQCMMSIFSDMVEKFLEVFMDDFSVFVSSFDTCLHNLSLVLQRCKETDLILSWEKSHFMKPPDWSLPFEIMCDAFDYAVGTVLGQHEGKLPHVIYYASKTLMDALNYTTTEKELLAVVFALDKFRSILWDPR